MKYRILVLDGGGSRGILSASFLHQLERRVGELQQHFNLVVGTSTGGIIAAALGKGLNTGEILSLYDKEIPVIFDRTLAWKVKSGWGVLGPKYDNRILHDMLQKYLGESDISEAKIRFITTAYNTDTNDVVLCDSKDGGVTFKYAALVTSVAPTYMPSYMSMIDGGIYANNPVLIGITEGLKAGYSFEDIIVVNVGTGYHPRGWNTSGFGVKEWLMKDRSKPLLDMMFDGMTEKDVYIAKRLLGDNYLYCNMEMDEKYPMDVTDRVVLTHLSWLGEEMFYENGDRLIEML